MFLIYCDIDSELSEAGKSLLWNNRTHHLEGEAVLMGSKMAHRKPWREQGQSPEFGPFLEFSLNVVVSQEWDKSKLSGQSPLFWYFGDLCIQSPEFSKVKGSTGPWKWSECRLVVSNFSWPDGLEPTRLLCPWKSPGKNTRVGCHCLLQGAFWNPGMEPGLQNHCGRWL